MGRISHVTRARCPKEEDGVEGARDASSCGCKGFWTGIGCDAIDCRYRVDPWMSSRQRNASWNNETAAETTPVLFWEGMTLSQFNGGSLCGGCRNGGHCTTSVCKHRRFYGQTYCYSTSEEEYTVDQKLLSSADSRRSYSSVVPCSPVNGSYFSYSQLRRLPTCKCWRGVRRSDGTCRCPDGSAGALCELESGNQIPMVGLLFDMNGSKLYGYNFHLSSISSSEKYSSSSSGHHRQNQIFDYYSIYNTGGGAYGRSNNNNDNNNGNSLTLFLFFVMLVLSMLMCFQRRRSSPANQAAVHHRCTVLAAAAAPRDQWGQLYFLRSLAGWSQNFRASLPVSGHQVDPSSTNNHRRRENSSYYVYERDAHTWRMVRVSPDRNVPLVAMSSRSTGSMERDGLLDVERQPTRIELPSYDEATQAPPPYGQIL